MLQYVINPEPGHFVVDCHHLDLIRRQDDGFIIIFRLLGVSADVGCGVIERTLSMLSNWLNLHGYGQHHDAVSVKLIYNFIVLKLSEEVRKSTLNYRELFGKYRELADMLLMIRSQNNSQNDYVYLGELSNIDECKIPHEILYGKIISIKCELRHSYGIECE